MVLTMCRLLGFATAGSNTSLNGVLGMQAVCEFRDLSEVHNDGWGAALVTVPEDPRTVVTVARLLRNRYRDLQEHDCRPS